MSSAHMSSGIPLWRGEANCFEFPWCVLQGARLALVSVPPRVTLLGEFFVWLLHVPGCCGISDSGCDAAFSGQDPALDVPWRWPKPPHSFGQRKLSVPGALWVGPIFFF